MSDRMQPYGFGQLMSRLFAEYRHWGSIFGVTKLYRAQKNAGMIFDRELETPIGPAAGPHTQLAQNIIAAYAAGARFFELKTVQIIDGEDLPVSKPCIDTPDEAYNVEWSTELTIEQARDQYIYAWYALKLISLEFGLGSPDGFVFNMSVGYDLAGISSPKVDGFIEGMRNSSTTAAWAECQSWTKHNLDLFANIDSSYQAQISAEICNSVTISTLHGCPPQEIEKIARYLLDTKGLNTYIKCNPTLLGYDRARELLDSLDYDYIGFTDLHFREDLQFADAIALIGRLQELAAEKGLCFGVKLSNTMPVENKGKALLGDEMYLSGRALYPLTVNLAAKLAEATCGKLAISFCGGVDLHNAAFLLNAGVFPLTMATVLLKPGGYDRLYQIARQLEDQTVPGRVQPQLLSELAEAVCYDGYYRKPLKQSPPRKQSGEVPLAGCFVAPCSNGCPIEQDIPGYLTALERGDYAQALRIILDKNPLPFITGTICPHTCMINCTRNNYEQPLDIRGQKLLAAEHAAEILRQELAAQQSFSGDSRIAIVGGGPAGLACAYFLARCGRRVTVFESAPSCGGVVRRVIPDFRISDAAIDEDVALIQAAGVDLRTDSPVESVGKLFADGYDYVVLATGAPCEKEACFPGAERTVGALAFLELAKKGEVRFGKKVVVIGGGNTAMDTARAAHRLASTEQTTIVYRRDIHNMPADEEELRYALAENIRLEQLLNPVSYDGKTLLCEEMRLGERGADGRQTVEPTGNFRELPADTVITAIGEEADLAFFAAQGIAAVNGRLDLTAQGRVGERIYVIGDAATGPATVVRAIEKARRCADELIRRTASDETRDLPHMLRVKYQDLPDLWSRRGLVAKRSGDDHEAARCLGCNSWCTVCAEVCPNRANVVLATDEQPIILHLDELCNECGNCACFCPYEQAPYRSRFTLYKDEESFKAGTNSGCYCRSDGEWLVRCEEQEIEQTPQALRAVREWYEHSRGSAE